MAKNNLDYQTWVKKNICSKGGTENVPAVSLLY